MSMLALVLVPTIWIVDAANGPGTDFVDLPPALAMAQSGDTILVRAGTYSTAALAGKALSIRGDGHTTTTVHGLTVDVVPAGELLVLAGLRFRPPNGTAAAGLVLNGPGSVLLTDCHVIGGDGTLGMPGLVVAYGAMVHAVRCGCFGGASTYQGPWASEAGIGARVIAQGLLTATDCALIGGNSHDNLGGGTLGGDGLRVVGATARLYGTTCFGGLAGTAAPTTVAAGGDAVVLISGSLHVVGGAAPLLQGGTAITATANAQPGYAIRRSAGLAKADADVVLLPAEPGAPLVSGWVVLDQPQRPLLTVTGTPLPNGGTDALQPVTVTFHGLVPNAPCFLLVGFRPTLSSQVAPELLVDLTGAGVTFDVLDGLGRFSFSFVPAWLLGLEGVPFFAQAGTFDPALGVRTSNCEVRLFGR